MVKGESKHELARRDSATIANGMWDTGAHPVLRQEAAAELMRRRQKRWRKVEYKFKAVYPK
ncbi:hypothetical protein [Paenibacillus apii]|uniref:hypothetical protein n=1 Tax=Paenibacillus apii TaxID=1850370 RepID=UPI001438AF0F|nr:hypothetical protein [Paenibacillus apii]NJJ37850.1 hypothetical protein [Paenibacillus apii]